jgi:acetyl esterase/lipase
MRSLVAFFGSLILILVLNTTSFGQQVLPLYEGDIPGSKPVVDKEAIEISYGRTLIRRITRPTLTVFLPKKGTANGCAVLICPGGGYWVNASVHEGSDVAAKFNEMGVTAFVLKYRIPNDSAMTNRETAPLQDAQQALHLIRSRASEWNVDPKRVGVMGFSAGGHLASTVGTKFSTPVIKTTTEVRPDFLMLIYPVISFIDTIGHLGSRDQLIGKNPTREKIIEYSSEYNVDSKTPPTFLVHASDDGAVKPQNSIVFFEALIRNKVPAELHIYQKGGHGFGLINNTTPELWLERCKNWMAANGWIPKR